MTIALHTTPMGERAMMMKTPVPTPTVFAKNPTSEPKPTKSLPKETVKGSVHLEFKKCGCPSCHCSWGILHGPYFYRRWRQGSRQRKAYVKPTELPSVLKAIEAAHASRPVLRAVRAQLRRLSYEFV
jgi:hypothetical protein